MIFKTRFSTYEPRTFATHFNDPSLTQQQFKEECDVNNILAKFKKTGMLSHVNSHQGNFGDFSDVQEYQTALEKLNTAQRSFESLPSDLRSKFDNDPAKLIDFINDEKNYDDAVKYGLIIPRKKEISMQEAVENALASNDLKRSKSKKDS